MMYSYDKWPFFVMDRKIGLSEDRQKEFVTHYLNVLHGYDDISKVKNEDINNLLKSIDYGCMLSSLFWGVWGIVESQRMEDGGWDYCEYSRVRLKDFFDLRIKYVTT